LKGGSSYKEGGEGTREKKGRRMLGCGKRGYKKMSLWENSDRMHFRGKERCSTPLGKASLRSSNEEGFILYSPFVSRQQKTSDKRENVVLLSSALGVRIINQISKRYYY